MQPRETQSYTTTSGKKVRKFSDGSREVVAPGGTDRLYQTDTAPTMSIDTLATSASPIIPSSPAPSNTPQSLDGALGNLTSSDTYTSDLKATADTTKKSADAAFDALLAGLTETKTKSELASTEYAKAGGVNEIQSELDKANQDIKQNDVNYLRLVERLQNKGGGLASGLQSELDNAYRDYVRNKADLYIIQQGVQGRYDSAKAIADRAVDAITERDTMKNAALKLTYERTQSQWTEEEKRAFESAQSDRENKIADDRQNRTDIYNLAIEAMKNGAGSSTVSSILSSATPQQALAAAGTALAPKTGGSKLQFVSATANQPAGVFNPETGVFTPITDGVDNGEQLASEINSIQNNIDQVNDLLNNDRGIGASTGQLQSPYISGFFQGGKASGVGTLTRFVPVVGNVQGAIQSANDKDNFLSGVSYLVSTTGFAKIIETKAQGVTYGSLSEGERTAAYRAANLLNAAVETETDGTVTGIRATDDKVREWLGDIKKAMEAEQNAKYMQLYLSPDEQRQIINQ